MHNDIDFISEIENEIGYKLELLPYEFGKFPRSGYSLSNNGAVLGLAIVEKKLKKIPQAVSKLRNLVVLNLQSNSLTDISLLKSLFDIEILVLTHNRIANIKHIGHLKKLKSLEIGENRINNISIFQNFQELEYCDISINQISDINSLRDLKKLQSLILWANPISDLRSISELKNLTYIDICDISIKDISMLQDLKKLSELDLRNNDISDISSLEKLTKLRVLHLESNDISDISSLKNFEGLEEIYLQRNQISDISALERLENLKKLNLSGNNISIFPRWLTSKGLDNIPDAYYTMDEEGYSVQGNPISNVPAELLKQDNGAINDYFKSLENGSQPINEIKVIFLGEGAAGKTSLLNYLQGNPFNENQSQTHGINLADCIQESGVTLKLWDFGGQDIMHHTHQFFLTQKSVYVLVLNARENSDTEKWLKLIQVFGGDSPIIIVTNKIDENPSDHENIKYLNTKYDSLKGRYVRISCSNGNGLEEFKDLLSATIKDLLHVRTQWGYSWLGVKRDLEAMRNGEKLKDYIHFDKYDEICAKHNVPKSHRETLITWLHQLGVITYFTDPNLNETNVINPSWLTEGFYSIINSKYVADNFGRFSIDQLSEILDKLRYPKHKYNFLLGLMVKFELCYKIDECNFLIPDLLNKEEPDFNFEAHGALKLKIKYLRLLPKAVLPKFMVRRNQEIKDDKKWRTGLIIRDENFESEALIRVDEEDKEITIFVNGQEKRGYLASILTDVENINSLYEGLEYEKLVPCICSDCIAIERPFYYNYDVLKKSREKGRRTYICGISDRDVLINDLLGVLITREELEKEIKKLLGKGTFKTKQSIEQGDIHGFIEVIKSLFSSVSYLLFEKNEKSYHTPLFVLLRAIFGSDTRADEIQTRGRADIIMDLENFVYILELKLDGTTDEAMEQIHKNKYYEPYYLEEKNIILIGINFSSKSRNIDDYKVEIIAK